MIRTGGRTKWKKWTASCCFIHTNTVTCTDQQGHEAVCEDKGINVDGKCYLKILCKQGSIAHQQCVNVVIFVCQNVNVDSSAN